MAEPLGNPCALSNTTTRRPLLRRTAVPADASAASIAPVQVSAGKASADLAATSRVATHPSARTMNVLWNTGNR